MGLFENDITQGIKNIDAVSLVLKIPIRTIICSKIIFHRVYPLLKDNHSLTDLSFISLYLSTKIEETHIKLENLINAINTIKNIKLNRQTFILCEANIIQALKFNFEIQHVHLFVIRICKKYNLKNEFQKIYNLFNTSKVNKIYFFGEGIYDPAIVGLAFFDDKILRKIETEMFVDINMELINEVRNEFYNN